MPGSGPPLKSLEPERVQGWQPIPPFPVLFTSSSSRGRDAGLLRGIQHQTVHGNPDTEQRRCNLLAREGAVTEGQATSIFSAGGLGRWTRPTMPLRGRCLFFAWRAPSNGFDGHRRGLQRSKKQTRPWDGHALRSLRTTTSYTTWLTVRSPWWTTAASMPTEAPSGHVTASVSVAVLQEKSDRGSLCRGPRLKKSGEA